MKQNNNENNKRKDFFDNLGYYDKIFIALLSYYAVTNSINHLNDNYFDKSPKSILEDSALETKNKERKDFASLIILLFGVTLLNGSNDKE
jgi:hypothetical protein